MTSQTPNILLIDDDPSVGGSLSEFLSPAEYKLYSFLRGEEALERFPELKPDVVLLDLNLPGMSGLEVLKKIKTTDGKIPVIVLTGHISTESAIEAMKEGAFDYITKPYTLEKVAGEIKKALADKKTGKPGHPSSGTPSANDNEIIGQSPEIVEIAKLIGQVAKTDASVLIMGESGTGKELVARAIFRNSRRADKAFLSVNCAALPEALLESELFGHEKGAFTGAYARKIGKFEQCHTGTIFLDEIADMSLVTQSKVLRVLQEQEFERVSGNESIKVDVRVIAATNRSLVELIKDNKFRVDLFYRLKVVSIFLPPLRERRVDIPILSEHFLKKYTAQVGNEVKGISREAMEMLSKYHWPGNVRELENNVHTAVVMCKGEILTPEHFPLHSDTQERLTFDYQKIQQDYYKLFSDVLGPVFNKVMDTSEGHIYDHLFSALEKAVIEKILKQTESNQLRSAKILGVSRNTLRDRMAKYQLT
ncbi:MAG: hypothetical protein A2Z27_02650 [candidate division Zixibacteria bacterium RBG_16_50_21]|nr:MAG: hypothetical protein A2Z27_02650 [candidate division Zixibacteria bacterium RBG_16_50_21]